MGTLLRITLIVLAVWLVLRFVKQLVNPPLPPKKPREALSADVVPCAYCGTYIPESDAVRAHGRVYCSQKHADKKT
jgi:uncharacterized protein